MYIPELCTARLSEQSASPCQQCPPEGEPAASGRSVSGPQAGPPATAEREERREKTWDSVQHRACPTEDRNREIENTFCAIEK